MKKETNKQISTDTKIGCDTVLATVYINDMVPYNEYDHASNGGYFGCPYCDNLEYVSESEHGKTEECSACYKSFIFNGL